jgi:long-subunit fatty acid transport protein
MMRRTVALRWSLALIAAGALLPGTSWAQTDVEVNAAVQFNFTSPGARSLALGGAFIGLADDATAAFTNPAGLTTLSKPEISAEGRGFKYNHLFTNAGRLGGTATGRGVDTINGIADAESEDSVGSFSFASFVYPKGRFAVAAYRHELANFKASILTNGAFLSPSDSRLFPIEASMDLKLTNYGLSTAYRFGEGFSLGAGISAYQFKLASTTDRFNLSGLGTGEGGFYGPPLRGANNVVNSQTQQGDETAVGFNVGLSWKTSEKVRFGAVYRKGPDFDFEVKNVSGPAAPPAGRVFATKTAHFHVPDAYGAGLSIRATESLTVAMDYQRVQYSRITKDFTVIFPFEANPADFTADDSNEFHAGLEYVLTGMSSPIAIRFGAWNDPGHRVRFAGPLTEDTDQYVAAFREGDDEVHVSGGLGIVVGSNFQLDGGVDVSKRVKTFSFSGVLRF